jgi:hypothetical protein
MPLSLNPFQLPPRALRWLLLSLLVLCVSYPATRPSATNLRDAKYTTTPYLHEAIEIPEEREHFAKLVIKGAPITHGVERRMYDPELEETDREVNIAPGENSTSPENSSTS